MQWKQNFASPFLREMQAASWEKRRDVSIETERFANLDSWSLWRAKSAKLSAVSMRREISEASIFPKMPSHICK